MLLFSALLALYSAAPPPPAAFAYHGFHRTWPNWWPDPVDSPVFDGRQRRVVPSHAAAPAYPLRWRARVQTERRVNGRPSSNETWRVWSDGPRDRSVMKLLANANGTLARPVRLVQFFRGENASVLAAAASGARAGRTYVFEDGTCNFWCGFLDPLYFVPGAKLHTLFASTHRQAGRRGGAATACEAEFSLCAPLYARDARNTNRSSALSAGEEAEAWQWVEAGFALARDELRLWRGATSGTPLRLERRVQAGGFKMRASAVSSFADFAALEAAAAAAAFPGDGELDACPAGSAQQCPPAEQRQVHAYDNTGAFFALINPTGGGQPTDYLTT
eukprot:g7888.t1